MQLREREFISGSVTASRRQSADRGFVSRVHNGAFCDRIGPPGLSANQAQVKIGTDFTNLIPHVLGDDGCLRIIENLVSSAQSIKAANLAV